MTVDELVRKHNLTPVVFLIEQKENSPVHLVRITKKAGGLNWGVFWLEQCLNKDGEFVYQPIPSNRDEAFVAAHRFETAEEAFVCFMKSKQPVTPE